MAPFSFPFGALPFYVLITVTWIKLPMNNLVLKSFVPLASYHPMPQTPDSKDHIVQPICPHYLVQKVVPTTYTEPTCIRGIIYVKLLNRCATCFD